MHDMPMPGSSTMSGVMPVLMMAAMMLPSSALMLRRDRQAAASRGETRLLWRTVRVGTGYFFVWIAISVAAAPLTAALSHIPAIAAGAIVMVGALQFTAWKARQLACWHELSTAARAPFPHGLRLGIHCVRVCGNLMAILIVTGAMDSGAMAIMTAVITAERVVPASERAARLIGAVVVVAGLMAVARIYFTFD